MGQPCPARRSRPWSCPYSSPIHIRGSKDSEQSRMGCTQASPRPQTRSRAASPGRFPRPAGADTKPPSRGWGHTGASPSNVAPLHPHPVPSLPLGSQPPPQSPAPGVRGSSPYTHAASVLPSPPTGAPQPHAGQQEAALGAELSRGRRSSGRSGRPGRTKPLGGPLWPHRPESGVVSRRS